MKVARWLSGVVLVAGGVAMFINAPIAGTLSVLLGCAILPPVHKFLSRKGLKLPTWGWWIIGTVLFVGIGLTLPPAEQAPNTRILSAAQYGEAWPFTVESGEIGCLPIPNTNTEVITFTVNGVTYALNGIAEGHGFADIDPIWRENPNLPGTKINTGLAIEAARTLCR